MTYITWFSDIGLYLEDLFMYKSVTLAGGIREPLLTCSSFTCLAYLLYQSNNDFIFTPEKQGKLIFHKDV